MDSSRERARLSIMARSNTTSLLNSKSLEQVRQELSSRAIPLIVTESFILASISLAAIFGNILVVMAIFKSSRLKSPTNYLIASLALSDFLTALIVVPMSTGVLATGEMFMGVPGCKAFGCLSYLLANISFYTVGLLAFNRFLLAWNPKWYDYFFSTKSTIMTILSSWVIQLVYALLPAVTNWSEVFLSPGYTVCALFVTDPTAKLIYRTQSEVQVIGGLVIIIVCYAVVLIKIRKIKSIFPEKQSNSNPNNNISPAAPAAKDHSTSRYLANSAPDDPVPGEANRSTSAEFCADGTGHEKENQVEEEKENETSLNAHTPQEPVQENDPEELHGDTGNYLEARKTSDVKEQRKTRETEESSVGATSSHTSNASPQHPHRFLSQMKTTRLMLAITLCFLFSWIPLSTMIVVESYQSTYAARQVELFGMTLLYLGTTFNPIVLPLMCRRFRKEFLKMLCIRNTAAVHPQ